MSIRSHNSRDSYLNRPLTNGGSRRNRTPSPIPPEALAPEETEDFCEECKKCPYKRLVEKAMIGNADKPMTDNVNKSQDPKQPQPESKSDKPRGLFKRFGDYVAKNQAANKAAGDTSLTDDLVSFGKSYGKGLSDGAARVAGEEIAKIDKQRSVQKSEEEDDELINFLSGKKKRK
jgi:hypothetical protein